MDPVWDDIFRSREWGRYPPEHVVRFVARNFYGAPYRGSVRLLDLGSGPGACTWYMAREGFQVSAIDGSAEAIDRLERRLLVECEDLDAPVDAVVGDVTQRLPWPDATFDGVVDNGCLCCSRAEDWRAAVGEVARVLKPSGLLYSVAFDPSTAGYGTGRQVGPLCYEGITEGPLAGRGRHQFADADLLPWLYSGLELVERHAIAWSTEPIPTGARAPVALRGASLWLSTLRRPALAAQEAA